MKKNRWFVRTSTGILTAAFVFSGCASVSSETGAEETEQGSASSAAIEAADEIEESSSSEPAVLEEETVVTPANLPWTTEDLKTLGEEVPECVKVPEYFSFSGGTGRASISCLYLADRSALEQLFSLTEDAELPGEGDDVFAMIRFDSSHYDYYTIDGLTYYTAHGEDSSYALVPVRVNQNMELTGLTTAMSAGHEITYQIYIGCAEDGSDVSAVTTAGDSFDALDKAAPLITGLPSDGELLAESGLLRIFSYGEETFLIELDTGMADRFDELADEPVLQRSPYLRPVIKYLVVPEGTEMPAGMEKLLVVVPLPADSIYSNAAAAGEVIRTLGGGDRLKSADGLPDYRSLITDHTDLFLADGALLPDEQDEGETWLELSDTMTTLNIPMFIDRSAEDFAGEADQTWKSVYKLLLS